jgi:hypothetical protein
MRDKFEVREKDYHAVTSSASTQMVERHDYPNFLQKIPNVEQEWSWTDTGTTEADAVMDVIRKGNQGESEWKADRWWFWKTADGKYWARGPDRDIDYGHHTDHLPGWDMPSSES